jgi:hypothetical protein
VIINNLLKDEDLDKKVISEGSSLKAAVASFSDERARFAFYILLSNIVISMRELRSVQVVHWSQSFSFLKMEHLKALRSIFSYFPSVQKMERFLRKFD